MSVNTNGKMKVPTQGDAMEVLTQALGAIKAYGLWKEACEDCGLSGDEEIRNLDMLYKVIGYLAKDPGLLGMKFTSMRIRLLAYLNQRHDEIMGELWIHPEEAVAAASVV